MLDGRCKLDETSNYTYLDFTLSENSYVKFSEDYLGDLWVFTNPSSGFWGRIIVEPPWLLRPVPAYVVRFQRREAIPFIQLILPAMLCYLLLGSSMMINKGKLELRLRVYVPLFVLAPTFLLSMQHILPSHGAYGLLLPEVLLTNLIVATTIFSVSSILHPHPDVKGKSLDTIAVTIAIAITSYTFIVGSLFFNLYIFLFTVIPLLMGPAKELIESLRVRKTNRTKEPRIHIERKKSKERKNMRNDNKELPINDWTSKLAICQTSMSYEQSIRVSYQSLLAALETILFGFVIVLLELQRTESLWILAMMGILLGLGFGASCEFRARNVDFWRRRIVELAKATDLADAFAESKYGWVPGGKVGCFGEKLFGHWFERMIVPAIILIWLWILTW